MYKNKKNKNFFLNQIKKNSVKKRKVKKINIVEMEKTIDVRLNKVFFKPIVKIRG